MISQLLMEMDGVQSSQGVTLIAATNRPDMIDKSFLRAGRFEHMILVPPPDKAGRMAILRLYLAKLKCEPAVYEDSFLDELADQSRLCTGADLKNICNKAGLLAVEEKASRILVHHFRQVLHTYLPSVSMTTMVWYEQF